MLKKQGKLFIFLTILKDVAPLIPELSVKTLRDN